MRLLQLVGQDELILTQEFRANVPSYCILSHTWAADDQEITFDDVRNRQGHHKDGYKKALFCVRQARKDNVEHSWVDTCCINKAHSSELNEAIISMFAWYKNAAKCYVYLSDVSSGNKHDHDGQTQRSLWEPAFRSSRWFMRGWTLQELLAPTHVEFYSREGQYLGNKASLGPLIQSITDIPLSALQGTALSTYNVSERMQWAATRVTTKPEDRAYCLLGVFNVFMPVLYGEGENAFLRLEEEIRKRENRGLPHAKANNSSGLRSGTSLDLDALLESLPTARQAAFDAVSKQDDPLCHPDTRVEVLKRIRAWAYGNEASSIFWLNGMAGTGKSTIARTIAREFEERGCLGASFFFTRGDGDVAHAGLFFTTIAKQLARRSSPVRQYILHALSVEPDIADKTRRDQWMKMIVEPLRAVPARIAPPVLIIVVDALDECSEDKDIQAIISLLSEVHSIANLKLRVIVTSRPETPIRLGFKTMRQVHFQDLVLHDERREVVDADICLYLYDELEHVKMAQDWLAQDWPGVDVINELVSRAGGLFIYAATVCRFVREEESIVADDSLRLFLRGQSRTPRRRTTEPTVGEASPTLALDRLYAQVLGKAAQHANTFSETLGIVASLCEPLTVPALANLLTLRPEDIRHHLARLHSVLYVPANAQETIHLFHLSFRDFMFDRYRCKIIEYQKNEEIHRPFEFDHKELHGRLAILCLEKLSVSGKLRRDMCSIGDPGIRREKTDKRTIEMALPPEISYACRYWVYHLHQSEYSIESGCPVHDWLEKYLLYWIEALSWLGCISRGLPEIDMLSELAQKGGPAANLLDDAKRFLLFNASMIDETPLQLYCSALMFAPTRSLVKQRFRADTQPCFTVSPTVSESWGPELVRLEGHDHEVYAVAVSPDGKLVASGGNDRTVRIWTSAAGKQIHHFDTEGPVNAVAFSPDGLQLAAGTNKGVRFWNMTTGEELQHPSAQDIEFTYILKYSPSGKRLAGASTHTSLGDRREVIHVWDTSGNRMQQFEGHAKSVAMIHFSPCERFITSSSCDGTVQTWNVATGEVIQCENAGADVMTIMAQNGDERVVVYWTNDSWKQEDSDIINCSRAKTATTVHTFDAEESTLDFHSVIISEDGKKIAAACYDTYAIRIWSLATGELLHKLTGHDDSVNALAFCADGKTISSASQDFTVRLWSLATDTLVNLEGNGRSVIDGSLHKVQFSRTGTHVALESVDPLKLYNVISGETTSWWPERSITLHFPRNGFYVASEAGAEKNSFTHCVQIDTGESILLHSPYSKDINGFDPRSRVSCSGRLIALLYESLHLEVFVAKTGERILFPNRLSGLSQILFTADENCLILLGYRGWVQIWNIVTGGLGTKLQLTTSASRATVNSPLMPKFLRSSNIATSSDGTVLAISSGKGVDIWRFTADEVSHTTFGDVGRRIGSGLNNSTAVSRSSKFVAIHAAHKTEIYVWDLTTGQQVHRCKGDRLLSSMYFSADDKYLITNIGRIYLTLESEIESDPINSHGHIRLAGKWIQRDGKDLVRLPHEHQGTCADYHYEDNAIVLGQNSGSVTYIRFSQEQ